MQQYATGYIHTLLPPLPPTCAPAPPGVRSTTRGPRLSPHRRCRRERFNFARQRDIFFGVFLVFFGVFVVVVFGLVGASELGGGQLPLKSDEGQNPAPGVPQAVVMGH